MFPEGGTRLLIDVSYLLAAFLFILGLKQMSSPVTARRGIVWAGVGMLVATLASFLSPGMDNFALMLLAIAIGGVLAWWSGKRVAMTDMPQMIALYNGMGGGSAAAIAAVELFKLAQTPVAAEALRNLVDGAAPTTGMSHGPVTISLAVLGAFIGAVSFSGSLIAFGKLQGLIKKSFRYGAQQLVNLAILLATLALGAWIVMSGASAGHRRRRASSRWHCCSACS